MLDREKVVKQLYAMVPSITRYHDTLDLLCNIWKLVVDEYVKSGAIAHSDNKDFPIPVSGNIISSSLTTSYTICGIDGSQIYPDRHAGIWAYLINTATVIFNYDVVSDACYHAVPEVGIGGPLATLTPEMINGLRTEREFAAGRDWAELTSGPNRILLFDGSLIFWHLLSKESGIKHRFLTSYCTLLRAIVDTGIICASYISAPNSRELIQLLSWYAQREGILLQKDILDELSDSDVLERILSSGETTPLFEHRFAIAEQYGPDLTPHFFYLHTGDEIARIEVLKPMIEDDRLAKLVAILIDQNKKGNGYPIVLSEAHEYAVVRSADREFFQTMLVRIAASRGESLRISRKLAKKRQPSI